MPTLVHRLPDTLYVVELVTVLHASEVRVERREKALQVLHLVVATVELRHSGESLADNSVVNVYTLVADVRA